MRPPQSLNGSTGLGSRKWPSAPCPPQYALQVPQLPIAEFLNIHKYLGQVRGGRSAVDQLRALFLGRLGSFCKSSLPVYSDGIAGFGFAEGCPTSEIREVCIGFPSGHVYLGRARDAVMCQTW